MQFSDNLRFTPEAPAFSRVYGFWRSLVFAIVLSLAAISGVFAPLDGLLHDAFVRNTPDLKAVTRKVVLVESPASSFSDSTIRWDRVVDDLVARGAAQVVFTALPAIHGDALDSLLSNAKVVVSAGAREREGLSLHAASVITDPLLGVHRSQRLMHRVGGKDMPSLEALAAARLGIATPGGDSYLVDFRSSASGFPRASLNQLLNGEVIDSMVRGRVILIGRAGDGVHRTVLTPVTQNGREVTELEFHGYALDTLLRGASIASFSPLLTGSVIIGVWLLCLAFLQPMPFRRAVLTAFLMATGLVLLSWLLFASTGILFPVLGPILVIASSVVSIFQSKTESQNQALARLVTETNLAASGRLTGQDVPFDSAFWSNVLAMIDQILPISRAVLLERVEGSRNVREVRSLRCTIDAIEERRRDFARAPYSTAIEKGETIEVRNYLMDGERGELQFLVPLSWSGQVLGFWVFGLRRSQMPNRAMLVRAVDILGKQLSELMFERRKQYLAQPAIMANWGDRLADQRDLSIQKLTQHMNMIDRHINLLEDMFNGMDVPTMVYDLFGRPLFSNARMKALLQAAAVRAEAQSAADLLGTVCILSAEDARDALVGVVFNGDSVERAAHIGNMRYRLHVSRLRNSSARAPMENEVLQQTHGLMIQLFPVTGTETREGKRQESDLQVPEVLHDREVETGVPELEEEVDVLHVVEEAIASAAAIPEHETLSFAVSGRQQDAKVLTHPGKLRDMMTALIQFLAEDSRQQGKITVNVDKDEDGLVIGFRNNGFGMPDDKLQAMLDGAALPRSDYLRRIRQLRTSAFGNQGELALHSTVGGGYVAKATMRLAD